MTKGRIDNSTGSGCSGVRRCSAALSRCIAAAALVLLFAQGSAFCAGEQSSEGIAPGTVVNQSNWQQYQQYMTEGMKAIFRGDRFWHFPQGFQIKVGATKPVPLPKFFTAATEKYAGAAKLTQTSEGGYVAQNYQGGLPFAEPLKGDPALTGQRVFWDLWYRFHPRVEEAPNCSYVLDQFGNMTRTADTIIEYSQLTHTTDPGYPPTDPHAGAYYYSGYGQQLAPEAGKYLTTLNLLKDDPAAEPELYMFVPTLRRSLRLSQSARCAPLFGTDLTFDDAFEGPPGLPNLFTIEYLGEKKVLTLMHAALDSFHSCGSASNVDPKYYFLGSKGNVPFPNQGSGNWELRDAYVISLKRLPQHAPGYCYGNRVIYVDKQNFFPLTTDLYDAAGNLYKWIAVFIAPYAMPGSPGDEVLNISGQNTAYAVNFQDRHTTVFIGLKGCTNSECDSGGFGDATRWALPEGLSKIMQ